MKSIVQERGRVPFARHTGERVYMRSFRKADGLPADLAHWQPTVDAMLDGVDTDGPIYLMVDQGLVRAGSTHRRPGVHIDGYWHPALQAHGSLGGGGHGMPSRGGHDYTPPAPSRPTPGRHQSDMPATPARPPKPKPSGDVPETHYDIEFAQDEGLILAADVSACRAYAGEWIGEIGAGGDCSHIDLSHLAPITMQSGLAYAGNVTMLHESLPLPVDCLRTVVRLNVPGWRPA